MSGSARLSPKANADDVKAVEDLELKMSDGEITDIPTTVG